MSGLFIVLEGPDGSGTTTHSRLLSEALRSRGDDVLLTCEPSDGPIGTLIRSQLASRSIASPLALQLMFCADRAWHVETVVQPALERGTTVVCDRYITSTLAYGEALHLDVEYLRQVNRTFPLPDVEIIALPPLETCMRRIAGRQQKDVLESTDLQRRVYGVYEQLALRCSAVVMDTSRDVSRVSQELLGVIEQSRLKRSQH